VSRIRDLIMLSLMLGVSLPTHASATTPEQLIQTNCAGCHADQNDPDAPYSRMSWQRKTPEGWQMTLFRMQHVHGVKFIDPAEQLSPDGVMRVLVRHFADTRGLTPAEAEPYRYILEKRLNTIEPKDEELYVTMCARCHSEARVGLQRRSEEEWRHLVHFHLAQFPTSEYSMYGRDRAWRDIALNEMVPLLTERYGLNEAQWTDWQASAAPQPEGRWRVSGYMPSNGSLDAVMTVTPADDGTYSIDLAGTTADGESVTGSGTALVYSGFEWRASVDIDGTSFKQVFALDQNRQTLAGRMFMTGQTEMGFDITAVKDTGAAAMIAVVPGAVQIGREAELVILGTQLAGPVSVGEGLELVEVVSLEADRARIKVRATENAAEGLSSISVGQQTMTNAVTRYAQLDRLEVSPAFAVGRVGENGGSQPKVHALFDAIGWSAGPDGESGTDDDLRLGPVSAQWHVEPWDAQAERDGDVNFAGIMDRDTGIFTPGAAGPNPERKYSTNNAGNLKVVATRTEDDKQLSADGHLIVTVQRWNNPPIP